MDEWTELETGVPTKIALHLMKDGEGTVDQDKHPAGSGAVGIFVDSCENFHAKMVQHGVTVTMAPEKQPWYVWTALLVVVNSWVGVVFTECI